MKLVTGGILLVAACGSVADKTLADAPPEDTLPADAAIDAAPPPPRCDPSKPFGAPVRVDALDGTADDLQAVLSSDELTVLFASNRAGGVGGYDLYVAMRTSITASWGSPSLLAGVNTAATETHPTISADGLTLFATYQATASSPLQVRRAARANRTDAFGALVPVTVVDTVANNYDPYVLPDQSAIYFASNRNANADDDLYVAQGSAGSFSTPAVVAGTSLATAATEMSPVVTPDQLNLYFRSNRDANQFDIWLATRTNLTSGFGAPVNVAAVNTPVPEAPNWISADNCTLYFTRNIGGAASNFEIYSATKPL